MEATGTNSSFPSTFRAISGALAGAGIGRITSVAVRVAGSLVHSLFTCAFATVGAVLGSIAGGVIGLVSETGFVRGTVIGVISGALVSMEVVESSVAIWHSDEYTIWQMFVVIWSLLTNRLMRGKVFPVMRSAMDIQMNATESAIREESDIFNASGTTGMRRVAIDKLPVTKFTEHDIMDVRGRQITCSVCLHNFEAGESARSLPQCCHVFHLSCIDSWLLCHASCPLCRRAV